MIVHGDASEFLSGVDVSFSSRAAIAASFICMDRYVRGNPKVRANERKEKSALKSNNKLNITKQKKAYIIKNIDKPVQQDQLH